MYFFISLFEYQDKNIKIIPKKNSYSFPEPTINDIKNYEFTEAIKIKEEITSICQIKNGIAVGDKKGKVHIYDFNENKLKKKYTISGKTKNRINYLYSLKNGNLISSNKNGFNIYQLESKKEIFIQEVKYEEIIENDNQSVRTNTTIKSKAKVNNYSVINDVNKTVKIEDDHKEIFKDNKDNNYYQILELKNDQLLYIDGSKLGSLQPIIKDNYQKNKPKDVIDKIVCIAAISDTTFCIYTETNNIIIFDSNNFEEKKKFSIDDNLTKIERVDIDILACLTEKNKLFLFCKGNGQKCENIEKIEDTNVSDIRAENKKLIVSYKNYIKEFELKFSGKGNSLGEVGTLEINKKNKKGQLKNICLLNKTFEENKDKDKDKDKDKNEKDKIVCCFNDILHVYKHK